MPDYTYPGVYIEELPSGVRTITGVATSITAFVGYTLRGPLDTPVDLYSFADFERSHGGLDRDSPLSYAVNQFFMNGGTHAIVVRVATGTSTTSWVLNDSAGAVLDVSASSPGGWANDHLLTVTTADARNPDGEFNLVVSQIVAGAAAPVSLERHLNLNMNPKSAQYAISVVNGASTRIRLALRGAPAFAQAGYAVTKQIDAAALAAAVAASDRVIVGTLDGNVAFRLEIPPATALPDVAAIAGALSGLIPASLAARMTITQTDAAGAAAPGAGAFIRITSAATDASSDVAIAAGSFGGLARAIGMGLVNGGKEVPGNAQHRPVPVANKTPGPGAGAQGSDGSKGGTAELIGAPGTKNGMKSLNSVDLFNILCIPETYDLAEATGLPVIQAGLDLCQNRRAFYIIDPPSSQTLTGVAAWTSTIQHRNAASYFPAVQVADPLDGFRPRNMAASGTLAGLYARTDSDRGVWKAPAGTDGPLRGLAGLTLVMNDLENGSINPKGVNALRQFSTYGIVAWGARTMKGADAQADEYKYVPVRRLALYLEESLYRGTQWVVFEPNDEPLWAQIRLNVGAFMHGMFRQGAFQGTSPREAYFVKCDGTTTTQDDRDHGIVNIIVGFAPLKPAEFVVIKLQQIAGDIAV